MPAFFINATKLLLRFFVEKFDAVVIASWLIFVIYMKVLG